MQQWQSSPTSHATAPAPTPPGWPGRQRHQGKKLPEPQTSPPDPVGGCNYPGLAENNEKPASG